MTSTSPTTPVPGSVLDGEALYERAVMFATRDKPSTSYLQRRLQIGFNAAYRLIERMEDEGLVSRPNSAGKRSILRPHREVSGESRGSSAGADTHRADGQVSVQLASALAEVERLKAENRDLRSIPWPRAYVMERASEWDRLLRETHGYIHTCRGSCGSDMSGRDHALSALAEARKMLSGELK